jgi:hypothetical protein
MLRFQLPVLPNHGGGITSSHSLTVKKCALKCGLVSSVRESEEAYIVRSEGASTLDRCKAGPIASSWRRLSSSRLPGLAEWENLPETEYDKLCRPFLLSA